MTRASAYRRITAAHLLSPRFLAGALPALALAAATAPPSARADDAPLTASGVEVVEVTADRREKPSDSVPMSVGAVLGEDLAAGGIDDTYELPFRVPGLVFTNNSLLAQPYIRGIGSDLITAGAENSVASFVDGVYQTRAVSSVQDLFDVDRVEVLKGPQGTLFGRNATGGAIRVVTHQPTTTPDGRLELGYGSYDRVDANGYANGPLVDGKLLGRLAGSFVQHDGYTDNVYLGRDLDDQNRFALRSHLAWIGTDCLKLTVSGDYANEDDSRLLILRPVQPLATNLGVQLGGTVPDAARTVLFDAPVGARLEVGGARAEAIADLDGATLTSTTAYRASRLRETLDLDGTEVDGASNRPRERSDAITQEVEVASSGAGRLDWLGGVFYLHEDAFQSLDVRIPLAGLRDQPQGDLTADAAAVFGELGYRILDDVKATAGLRYSYESRGQDYVEYVNGAEALTQDQNADWDAFTPRFVLEWMPTGEALAYASVSRGFKSGGFNSGVAQPTPFRPEYVWAYEVGTKNELLDRRLRAEVAAFYYDYSDIQLQVLAPDSPIPFPIVANAGQATLYGGDIGLSARPVKELTPRLGLALLHSRFDELDAIDPNDLTGNPDQSGNRLPKAPDLTVYGGSDYVLELPFGSLTLTGEYRYQSEIDFAIFGDPTVRQGGYGVWNAHALFASSDGHWTVRVYGQNLSNKLYAVAGLRLDGTLGNMRNYAPPRTGGVALAYRF